MADKVEPIKIAKAKVLSITEGTWKAKDGKELKKHTIVFQDVEDNSVVVTAECFQQKLPDEVKQGGEVENITIDQVPKRDGSGHDNRVKWERPQQEGGGGRKYGPSPAEMKLKYDQEVWKVIGVGMSYGVQAALAHPSDSVEETTKNCIISGNMFVDAMWDEFNKRRTGG